MARRVSSAKLLAVLWNDQECAVYLRVCRTAQILHSAGVCTQHHPLLLVLLLLLLLRVLLSSSVNLSGHSEICGGVGWGGWVR